VEEKAEPLVTETIREGQREVDKVRKARKKLTEVRAEVRSLEAIRPAGTEEAADIQRTLRELRREEINLAAIAGRTYEEALRKAFDTETYEKIIQPWYAGISPEEIQKTWIQSKYSTQSLALGMNEVNEAYDNVLPELMKLPEMVSGIWDIFEESERSVGLRTMRAITEPQANQIIILLGRQVDHLATIASNTTTLVHGLPRLAPALTPGMVEIVKGLKAGDVPAGVTAAPDFTTIEETSHKEDVNITITVNGHTEQIENGMLVDSVIPMLAAEESRLKLRREKAIGRRRVLG